MSRTMVSQVLAGSLGCTRSKEQPEIECTFGGILGDRHFGATKPAGVRERKYARTGQEILNLRQVSVVSESELRKIARNMGVEEVRGADLGANIVVRGIERISKLPYGAILKLPEESGVLLFVTGENRPCVYPGENIQERYPDIPDLASKFPKAASGLRGLVAIVLRPGRIRRGESVEVLNTA